MELQLLLSRATIAETVTRLAAQIDQDYQGRSPIVVGVLKGSAIFVADLVRAMQTPIQRLEFIQLSSYGSSTQSSGSVVINGDLPDNLVRHRDLLVVEDIVDTGHSWAALQTQLWTQQPRSLKICTLLDKPSRRQVTVTLDYIGCQVGDLFTVGYGLDLNEQYRQLPDIYTLVD